MEEKKYYLVSYNHQPYQYGGYEKRTEMYEFNSDKTPLECYDMIKIDLNKDSKKEKYINTITNMKRIK
jgi:hypothetical protein